MRHAVFNPWLTRPAAALRPAPGWPVAQEVGLKPAPSHSDHRGRRNDPGLMLLTFVWSKVMMLKLLVEETKRSISDTKLSMAAAWKPSIHACRAQMESHSAMNTRAPESRKAKAQPLPTLPCPHTNVRFPPIVTSVVRMMPSLSE